jgi:hypothetical protein
MENPEQENWVEIMGEDDLPKGCDINGASIVNNNLFML